MLEFSISNQLLSRLDATKVVADSENYLECAFQFSEDWNNTLAVATFGHSKVAEPIPVRIVDGKCRVPHEVIKTYGFMLSVCGTAEETEGKVCHIPTNAVTVEVEASGAGQGLAPAEPTQSLYDTLMTAVQAGETAAVEAKVSAQASAGTAKGAATEAKNAQALAEQAAGYARDSAAKCVEEVDIVRQAWGDVRALRREMETLTALNNSYVVGEGEETVLHDLKDLSWTDGTYTGPWLGLNAGSRYRVRVNDTWYIAATQWTLEERERTEDDDQAELSSIPPIDEEETPEIPGGDEVNPGGNTGGDGGQTGPGGGLVTEPFLGYKTVREIVKLTAGPVTLEDVTVDEAAGEQYLCRMTTTDPTVTGLEIRTDGKANAKYFCEQAMAAAQRAEEALKKLEARG